MEIKPNEIKSVDLMITNQCNMHCSYCFHQQNDETMSMEDGMKILDKLKEISPDEINLTFFGGEPFLYPALVFDLAVYAKKIWNNKVGLFVSTNGTFFDEDYFKKLKDLGFSIQVSIDGDEATTKECRGNFELVTSNIKKMIKIFPNLSARMTYTPQTVGRLSINVKFIVEDLGIMRIMHHAVMEADWDEGAIKNYAFQLNNIYHYRRFLKRRGINIDILFVDKNLKILDDLQPGEINFCEAGKSYLAINPNGDVYPCHRAASNKIFKLGNIFNKIPFIRGMFLNISKELTGCAKNCEASKTCHSCPITHYKVNGDLYKPINKYCKICQIEMHQAFDYIPTERADYQESFLKSLAKVVADVSERLGEMEEKIKC